jgi:hypothetical protein
MSGVLQKIKSGDRKTILAVVAVAFFVIVIIIAIVVSLITSEDQEAKNVKGAISESIDRADFDVNDIIIHDNDWYLVSIKSTSLKDKDNPAFTILKQVDNSLSTILGPGTAFSIEKLYSVGAPDSIVRYFFKEGTLWVGFDEFDTVISKQFTSNSKTLIQEYAQKNSVDLVGVFVVKDSVATRIENERQDNMTNYIDFKFTINGSPDNTPPLTVSVSGTSQLTTGKILDDKGVVLAERVYYVGH